MRRRLVIAGAAALCLLAVVVGLGATAGAEDKPTTLRAVFASFPDYMDPQLSYTYEGWNAMYDVYVPLLTYRHADGREGTEIVPGLAESMPRISDGGRTYTLFLRQGLRYSDGSPVRASDFEYAIKRLFKFGSGGFPFYTVIEGAGEYLRTKRGGISGIDADNRSGRIVIHLVEPTASFTDLLALMFAAPVPSGTPMHDLSADPPPGTGPYYLFSSEPGRGWSYLSNPAWAQGNGALMPEIPTGEADRVDVRVVRSPEAEVKAVLDGRADWMQNPPLPMRFETLRRKFFGKQLRLDTTPSTYYFWMKTQKPPFNDLRIRRAANYAVNPGTLRQIYGGQLAPTHQILPPEIPGHEKFNLYPTNLARARSLVAAAHPADRNVTVWTDTESPNLEAGEYFASCLRQIGLKVRLKVVSADSYFTVIGSRRTKNLDAGWSDWFADYPNPDDFFRPLLLGSSILPFYNGNFARIAVPRLDRAVERLRRQPLGPATEEAYARLDRDYMKLAPWVPYGTRVLSTFVSKRVDLGSVVFNPMFGADIASFRFG